MNSTPLSRTDAEILAKIEEIKHRGFDPFNVMENDLAYGLSFDAAVDLRRPTTNKEAWDKETWQTREKVLATMLEYMPFAWEKANSQRGLSAARSLMHFWAWGWLIGEDFPWDNYTSYGKPQLTAICQKLGWDYSQWDDGVRVSN